MSAELLAHPLSQAVTWVLLHFVWQGLLVAIGLLAVVELFEIRRPQVRYLCSLTALLLMVACPLVTALWLAEGTGNRGQETVVALAVLDHSPLTTHYSPTSALFAAAQPYVLAVWLAGVALFGGRLLLGFVGIRRLRKSRLPLPRELADRVEQIGKRLAMRARSMVFLSRRVSEAMAVGLLKPIVLIPAAWASEMPLAMLEAVIAHELAHLQRRDLWVNMLQRVVETLLFYHPAVWWLSRRLRAERELCCDELAVAVTGRRLEYVQALETVARRGARVESLLAVGIRGERNMQLLGRVRNVLGLAATSDRSRLWPAGLVALLLPLVAWGWSAGLIAPQPAAAVADDDDDDDDKKERGKEGAREKEDDDDDKPAARKGEKEADDEDEKEVRKDGEKRDAVKKEVRKDGDDEELARRKREKIEQLKFLGKDDEAKRDLGIKKVVKDGEKPVKEGAKDGEVRKVIRKDGDKPVKEGAKDPTKPVRKDGEKPVKEGAKDDEPSKIYRKEGEERREVRIEIKGGEGGGEVAELAAMVKKLMAENAELRAALAAARGDKKPETTLKGYYREKEAAKDKEAPAKEKPLIEKRGEVEKELREKEATFKRALIEKEAAVREKEAAGRDEARRAIAEKIEILTEKGFAKEAAELREQLREKEGARKVIEIRERKVLTDEGKAALEKAVKEKEEYARRARELAEQKKAEAKERADKEAKEKEDDKK